MILNYLKNFISSIFSDTPIENIEIRNDQDELVQSFNNFTSLQAIYQVNASHYGYIIPIDTDNLRPMIGQVSLNEYFLTLLS